MGGGGIGWSGRREAVKRCVCEICRHGWLSKLERPQSCPRCKRYDWDVVRLAVNKGGIGLGNKGSLGPAATEDSSPVGGEGGVAIAEVAILAIKEELKRTVEGASRDGGSVITEVRPGVFGRVGGRVRVKPGGVQRGTPDGG
jgi:hypothetical protein